MCWSSRSSHHALSCGIATDPLGLDKPSLHDKFDEDPDITAIPAEVQYLNEEELKVLQSEEDEYDDADFVPEELVDVADLEDEDDEDDEDISAEEWAENFERDVAEWDGEEDDDAVAASGEAGELEDDRLYIVRPSCLESRSRELGERETGRQRLVTDGADGCVRSVGNARLRRVAESRRGRRPRGERRGYPGPVRQLGTGQRVRCWHWYCYCCWEY